jgi:DNA-directed RNA polymerase specialized sigma24 family protein
VELEELRAEYLAATERYERAAAAMRTAMTEADDALEVVRAHVRGGKPLFEVFAGIGPAGLRNQLSQSADELERARHATQRVVFAMLVAEGLTMAEIGRTFGISRSLVSRMVHEES